MNPTPAFNQRSRRTGIAVLWALVVLSVLSATSATAAWQFTTARRRLEARQYRMQVQWLARAGAEVAAARLLADPADYAGEALELLPDSQVRISVTKDAARPDAYRIECEARYPVSGPGASTHYLTRSATRKTEGTKVRIELVDAGGDGPAKGS